MAGARAALLLGLAVLFIAGAGAAFAFWSASGSGSGAGRTAKVMPVTLSPGLPNADLVPGGRADILLTMTNPNASSVRVEALVLQGAQGTGGFAVDAGHSGCALSALSYAAQTNGGVGWAVPPRSGSVDGTLEIRLPNALTMSLDAANACQGARITVYLAVGP
ncbi:hypothetical protein ACOCJ7_13025 [Knoellia sp. CPCC 206453]|uniref:hypothetical protein n=1 Tax=Knoellia pratensis TaxID=3404796 RepID=UPI00361BC4DF